ncbi:MAG: hypothetical protein Q9159_007053 [Coniocarpon cinnabarinum]
MKEFGHFHPSVVGMISAAPVVSDWPLPIHEPLPRWYRGKLVLIGDAAHPVRSSPTNICAFTKLKFQMLPFGGQGSNQAIEDAGALGVLFRNMQSLHDVPTRLQMFEDVRRLRASRVQTLSKVRLGKEKDVELELRKFADPPDSGMICSLHCVTLAVLMK